MGRRPRRGGFHFRERVRRASDAVKLAPVMAGTSGADRDPRGLSGSSEKDFYLSEFRGRTLALALAGAEGDDLAALEHVLDDLAANATRCLLVSSDAALLDKLAGDAVVAASDPSWVGHTWRLLRTRSRAAISVADEGQLAARCREIALRGQFAKLVWIDPEGPLYAESGGNISLVDIPALDGMLAEPSELGSRAPLLRELRAVVAGGVPSVNLCNLAGLHDELFTYQGSGTLFTRERYIRVRALALDEFDAAWDLIGRGVADGFLAERSEADLERLLSHAYGVFVEGRYLGGICSMLPVAGEGVAELAGLYTITRFAREGMGGRLLRFVAEEANRQGLRGLFACTTSERVEQFFVRHGWRSVGHDQIPDAKWQAYDPDRKAQVRCLWIDVG